MSKLVALPLAFAKSSDYEELDEEQRLSLLRRLDSTRALGESLASGKRLSEALDTIDFFENLELDVAILQELDSAHRGGLSRWLLHYSWTFETSPPEMRQSLPAHLSPLLDAAEPESTASLEKYLDWFTEVGRELVLLVEEFSAAATFASALAIHVLIDLLLARLLLSCYKLRLNQSLQR